MTRHHRPSPAGSARRRRQAPPPFDANELLALLAEVRGTPQALDVWHALTEPLWNGGTWRDADPLLRMIQAMGDAGIFSPDERLFLFSSVGDAVMPSRASEDPRFAEVNRAMERLKREHGLGADEAWLLDEAPEEYRALNTEWCRIADEQLAAWWLSLGEREMAWLQVHDEGEWYARHAAGREELMGAFEA
jgi:hypothetical protein